MFCAHLNPSVRAISKTSRCCANTWALLSHLPVLHRDAHHVPRFLLAKSNLPGKSEERVRALLLSHDLSAFGMSPQERTYIPEDQRYTNKNSQAAFCYSETIPAPTGKDDAQQKSVSCLPWVNTALFYGTEGLHVISVPRRRNAFLLFTPCMQKDTGWAVNHIPTLNKVLRKQTRV